MSGFFFRSAETAGEGALARLAARHNEEEECYAHLMEGCPWFRAVASGRNADHSMCKPAPEGKGTRLVAKLAHQEPQTLEEANYRETDSKTRSCFTCEYSKGWQGKDGHCTMFDAPVARGHVCDEWDGKKAGLAAGGLIPNDPGPHGDAVPVILSGCVYLTPRTPEASTVVQPTVPPGGPGLFHIKGEHLPPYVEHLYKHLVGRYGKKKAYGVAVGVVKKWAAGVNPGGRHPTRTHADVRAAAARNVAEWEASRAKAHAQSRDREARRRG